MKPMNLIYRDSLWCALVGETPQEPKTRTKFYDFEDECDYEVACEAYQEAFEIYITSAVPFAEEEQEKVKAEVWLTVPYHGIEDGLRKWQPDPGKIYELKDWGFELKTYWRRDEKEPWKLWYRNQGTKYAQVFAHLIAPNSAHSFTEGDESAQCGILDCKSNGGTKNCIGNGCKWGESAEPAPEQESQEELLDDLVALIAPACIQFYEQGERANKKYDAAMDNALSKFTITRKAP